MTAWKTMESVPKDGTEILLVTRFQIHSRNGPPSRVVGYWHKKIERWRPAPAWMDSGEDLLPTHWTEIPELPT
jgi:hypothetical protein